jgi:NAD(P)-dependent dehydrogenase (short-subunit alcohol dehydrogenase family)
MNKTILITGATDGIGLETAKLLFAEGHTLLIHGRNPDKLAAASRLISGEESSARLHAYCADLSKFDDVHRLIDQVRTNHECIDVLINNAGVFKINDASTPSGIDVRFVVNTIAPYLITQSLLNLIPQGGRVVNLSSAAQAPVSLAAMSGKESELSAFDAYAQSKLAITMWTQTLSDQDNHKRIFAAVNPGSLLATKMVKEGFGMPGNDIQIGAQILVDAALSDRFQDANGRYFDNDTHVFADPHSDGLNAKKREELMAVLVEITSAQT